MSFVRPEIAAHVRRWREVGAAAGLGVLGAWIAARGGWLMQALGLVVLATALPWVMIALRRMRFLGAVSAPGMVEVDEGQVGYYAPSFGGFVALADLSELRLVTLHGRRHWRLKTAVGEVLLVPTDAAGAEKLYDAFATVPGIDMGRLAAALGATPGAASGTLGELLWRRASPAALT